jgi:MFS family permease
MKPGSDDSGTTQGTATHEDGSTYAWARLAVALVVMTISGASMYVVVVVLPAVQAEFGVARADASLPYTLTTVGFGIGGLFMGRLADRFGVMVPLLIGAVSLGLGFVAAGMASSIWTFALLHGVLIGLFGASAMFVPLIADTSLWFTRRRGIAVAICASGNYTAGAIWPPVAQHFVASYGWRATYIGIGIFCALSLTVLALLFRRRPPAVDAFAAASAGRGPGRASARSLSAAALAGRPFGMTPGAAQATLCIAGLACCVAMSMPQVHIVAYCGDLGYGVARGAQMLAVMLGFGIVSRLLSGVICDRIGGLRTLLLGSALQGVALLLFLPFDGLVSLFVISALFGLFQGGIVPAYAIIIREYFPPTEAGARVGMVLMFTLFGMALGGWLSGKIFDLTGSYHAAFVNGIGWNLLNLAIALMLLHRTRGRRVHAPDATAGITS